MYKWKLFVLGLAGFAVLIIGVLALGGGLFVAGPVNQVAKITAYYEFRPAASGSDSLLSS